MKKPTFEKRHFNLIAQQFSMNLRNPRMKTEWPVERQTIVDMAYQFADSLATTNPNFNRSRFLEACGVKD